MGCEQSLPLQEHTSNRVVPAYIANGQVGHLNKHKLVNEHRDDQPTCPFLTANRYQKPIRLKNVDDEAVRFRDQFHLKSTQEGSPCSGDVCLGSIMRPDKLLDIKKRSHKEVLTQATEFLEQYFASRKMLNTPEHQQRLKAVSLALDKSATYELTTEELEFGAKLAWRNAARCIGRIHWEKLKLQDARHARTAQDMFDALVVHIKESTNGGRLRPMITVFPQRTDGNHDYRVWNAQLIRYAGYEAANGTVIGDPANVEFTKVCQALGWKGRGGRFDVLPLVLSANGGPPQVFEIPEELVLRVNLVHPKYDWFGDLQLEWYALPAVANMQFDIGGIVFPGCPFSGWYMGTEIGARDICDQSRYNMLEPIGKKMGLDTTVETSLWKDRVLVEVNIAVLHSFQLQQATISDHHSAARSFIQFMKDEARTRGGCPADWVWIVPPMSGSITPVFHQEMLCYKIKPSFEYQNEIWEDERMRNYIGYKEKQTIHFKTFVRSLSMFTSLMLKRLKRRHRCTVLYASETGHSKAFAKRLAEKMSSMFHVQIEVMSRYDVNDFKYEELVLMVASTYGNGDPPENGQTFATELQELVAQRDSRSLSNVRYSVFALGSSAYPNFCAFGRQLDRDMANLGARCVVPVALGNELAGQEKTYNQWKRTVVKESCFVFGITHGEDEDDEDDDEDVWHADKFRLIATENYHSEDLCKGLTFLHKSKMSKCSMKERTDLQGPGSERQTILVKLDTSQNRQEMTYQPGDHLGVCPRNDESLVQKVLSRVDRNSLNGDLQAILQLQKQVKNDQGKFENWKDVERLPTCSITTALRHYLDITTPLSQALLDDLADLAESQNEKNNLKTLANDLATYEKWRTYECMNFGEVLDEYTSFLLPASFLLYRLPLLQPRYYSISSAPELQPGEVHATVAVVQYKTKDGEGPVHHGVCSSMLNNAQISTELPVFIRPAPSFHLPNDPSVPVIMIGPGTGIAPFRSFWQKRQIYQKHKMKHGEMTLYFGCRRSDMDDIYRHETEPLVKKGVLTHVHTAYSREPHKPKVYVQHLLKQDAKKVFEDIMSKHGHVYVCGDVSMAAQVKEEIINILQHESGSVRREAENYMKAMKAQGRYHEDVFGAIHMEKRAQSTSSANHDEASRQDERGHLNEGYQTP